MTNERQFIAIDLKSFYASVECTERGLDPLNTNLVVVDESRTDKTICLAVSPSLKSLGIPGRARLFEAKQKVREVNAARRLNAPGRKFRDKSVFFDELNRDPSLELDFIIAPPRMSYYMDYSRNIFEIYLRFVSEADILVYSVDEVFIDATQYLKTYKMNAREFAITLIREVMKETRITATAGIGTNMYLAKIAMDIVAKHIPADKDGVRVAELDERSYREKLWCHTPLTDFWRVGKGTAKKLEQNGMYTMGDIARCSVGKSNDYYNEELLYRLFGVNAELLIDHSWGWEPTEIADCKAYKPESKSLSSGQVLSHPYNAEKGKLVVMEMADLLSTDLVRKNLLTDQIVLNVGYDIGNLADSKTASNYSGEIKEDYYGRKVPKGAHGSINLERYTSSSALIVEAVQTLYDRIVDKSLTVRRFNVAVMHLLTPEEVKNETPDYIQLNFFDDAQAKEELEIEKENEEEKERRVQKTIIDIRDKYGKNSILKGMNMKEGATTVERNKQVGGHKA